MMRRRHCGPSILQRLLDRKGQIQTNIQANNQYLRAAESNLQIVSDLLIELRADIVGIAGTLSNEAERQTLDRANRSQD